MRISDWSSDVCSSDLMGEKPEGMTLDRIHNDGNYEPSNCRWATVADQHVNRRRYSAEARARIGAAAMIAQASRRRDERGRRSAERRVGQECVSTGRFRWAP